MNKKKLTEIEKELKTNDAEHCEFRKNINEMHVAIFGAGEDVGMKEKMDAMYEVFLGATTTSKIILKLIIIVGMVATAVTATLALVTGKWKP